MGTKSRRLYRLELLNKSPQCNYCKRPINVANSSLDHVVAKAKGGVSARTNLVLACKKCNGSKGDMPKDQWDALLPTLIKDKYFEMSRNQRKRYRKENAELFLPNLPPRA